VQDAGARRVGNVEGMRGIVRSMTAPSPRSTPNIATRGGTHYD